MAHLTVLYCDRILYYSIFTCKSILTLLINLTYFYILTILLGRLVVLYCIISYKRIILFLCKK